MRNLIRLVPFAAGALLCAEPPEWDAALAKARQAFGTSGGTACVVMLERADATTVRIRLQVLGASVREARFTGLAENSSVAGLELDCPKGLDRLQGSAMLGEQVHAMDIQLKGEDFRPRLRMRVPKQGERPETGTVVVGVAPPK